MAKIHIQSKRGTNALKSKLAGCGFPLQTDEHDTDVMQTDVLRAETILQVTVMENDIDTFVKCLTQFMLDDWKRSYLEEYLVQQHPFLKGDQREYLSLLVAHALTQNRVQSPDLASVLTDIEAELVRSFRQAAASNWIDIQGIVHFRVQGYVKLLEQGMEEMVEQFLSDAEYEEFVATLRYVLESNPPSAQTLHVFCTDERVWISDEAGQLYQDEAVVEAAAKACPDEEVNAEDLAMSILVTRSPCRIVLHDLTQYAAWPSFAETCERVFLGRVERCHNCSTCKTIAGNELT
ncbi:sporulation protein YtxC [Alicyclobacillus sp. SO9]|uniref:sporulation protein YtxC n=1 Tax=Alicyclobacillus sp. SO9 TaxID=2665646 RepID=UPI0018E88183|nr:sporulation protein YtxC [Alicyclobacillus sp. SO9]QQE77628.1 hypothetical protein GI364_17030 [Alicyclobacillus sp. SO9]